MKVVEQPNVGGFVAGMGETAEFTMAVNGPLIRNMLTNIYSNKEKTVVRELMANAFDAHAASALDEPISVALPARLDPTFVVRDYGVGMTHEFVMELYKTIGFSTKTDSNEMTGQFGVGSKSPLAITDTFTVRCFDPPGWKGSPHMHVDGEHDLNETGRVRLYAISFNDSNVPRIHHTFDVLPKEKDQIERGGVEVKVPIKPDIRHKILNGVTEQHFCWFDKPIQFEGAFDEIEGGLYKSVTKLSENFYLANGDASNLYGYWNVYVRQGFAVYPVSEHNMYGLTADTKRILEALCSTKGRAVMIDIPIGTADVTMAREDLQYNETSVANVSKIINECTEQFRAKLVEAIGDAKDYRTAFERICDGRFNGKINKDDIAGRKAAANLLDLVKSEINANYDVWHDTLPDIEDKRPQFDEDGWRVRDADGKDVYETYMRRPNKNAPRKEIHFSNGQFPEGKCILHSSKFRTTSCEQWSLQQSINFPLISVIYVMTSHIPEWKTRIAQHLVDTFQSNKNFTDIPVYAVRVPKKLLKEAQDFITEVGVGYYVFTEDDLPEATGTTDTKTRNYSKTSVYEWKHGAWSDTKIEPDYTEPAYYITRVGISHDCYSRHPDKTYAGSRELLLKLDNYSLNEIIRHARECGYLDNDTPIYRVTENQADKISKTVPGWTHLIHDIAPRVESAIVNDPYQAFNASKLANAHISNEYAVIRWIDRAFDIQSDNDAMAYDALKTITDHDESLKYFLAVRYAKAKHNVHVLAGTHTESLRMLDNKLFRASDTASAHSVQQLLFDGLYDYVDANHFFLNEVVGEVESSYGRQNLMRGLRHYVNGYCAAELKNEIAAKDFLDLWPVVEVFNTKLAKAETKRQKFSV